MMQGFFTAKETASVSRPDGKVRSCASCGLYKNVNTPRMKPFGNFKKGIMNIGEAPGEEEDAAGKPWQGKTGKLLQRTYRKLGIDLFEDCININACHCRPTDARGDNRAPTNDEIENCRRTTLRYIHQYNPKLVVLLGNSAVTSVIGSRWKKELGGISKWRGWQIPDQDLNTWICPTYHPSFVERSDSADITNIWLRDLRTAFSNLEKPFLKYVEPYIEYPPNMSVLDKIKDGVISFDYETTGKKPHARGHRIVTVSVADSPDHCFTFHAPKTRAEWQPFIRLVSDPNVGKIAQNMKFENSWTKVRLRTDVQNWVWDTMLATHLMDNRYGITGLKFQTFVNFGIVDYDSEINPFLRSNNERDNNSINRIYELLEKPGGSEKLLYYCALDSIYEYRLAMLQQSEILLPF